VLLPHPNDQNHQSDAEYESEIRHDPRQPIEAAMGGCKENDGAVGLNEPVDNRIIVVAAGNSRGQLAAHAIRVRAVDVVALEQNVITTADAHELVPQPIDSCSIVARANEDENRRKKA
jgi:hypothetical protein